MELAEVSMAAALLCAQEVKELEEQLAVEDFSRDGVLLDLRDRLVELGDLSVVAAQAKVAEQEQLELAVQEKQGQAEGARTLLKLWQVSDEFGQMSALAAKAKALETSERARGWIRSRPRTTLRALEKRPRRSSWRRCRSAWRC